MERNTTIYRWTTAIYILLWGCIGSPAMAGYQRHAYVSEIGSMSPSSYAFQSTSFYSSQSSGAVYSSSSNSSSSTSASYSPKQVFTFRSSDATVQSWGGGGNGSAGASYSSSTGSSGSRGVAPTYSFRSTSSFTPVVSKANVTVAAGTEATDIPRMRKTSSFWDEEPDGDPLGVVAPIGEPMVLLLMALLYAILTTLIPSIRHSRSA